MKNYEILIKDTVLRREKYIYILQFPIKNKKNIISNTNDLYIYIRYR